MEQSSLSQQQGVYRAFLGFEITHEAKQMIVNLQHYLRETLSQEKMRWVAPEKLHVTLKFFAKFNSSDLDKIFELIKSFRMFDIKVGGLFEFVRYKNCSLALKIESAELMSIASAVNQQAESLGYPADSCEYTPHITLARCDRSILSQLSGVSVEPMDYSVRIINLFRSELTQTGSIYSSVKHVTLR